METIEVDEKKLNPWYLTAFLMTDIGVKKLKKDLKNKIQSTKEIFFEI